MHHILTQNHRHRSPQADQDAMKSDIRSSSPIIRVSSLHLPFRRGLLSHLKCIICQSSAALSFRIFGKRTRKISMQITAAVASATASAVKTPITPMK